MRVSAPTTRALTKRREALMPNLIQTCAAAILASCGLISGVAAHEPSEEHSLDAFERQILTEEYYSEGIGWGDINGDSIADVVYGPHWYQGPELTQAREIYPAKPQNRDGYSDHFFHWVHDFNADGLSDVLVCGLPGTPGYLYENPGEAGWNKPWPKTEVVDSVGNEAPQFVDLVGDETPELIFTHRGHYAYASPKPGDPFGGWELVRLSDQVAPAPFGHGLGVGDVNADGRQDILCKDGWYEQPEVLGGQWPFHAVAFAGFGGADMFVEDCDGDGDGDVITSLAAHEFGLAWHEQIIEGGSSRWVQHLIMGSKPEENRYGVVFSELHSVAMTDVDGDGLRDIVTGKTYWSHHTQSPMWDAGAVVYWFRHVIGEDGSVDWIPMLADGDSGIGRQLVTADLDGDGLDEILVGGMKGASVLHHSRTSVDEATYRRSTPQAPRPLADGLEPQAAAENMSVPLGFQLQLAAGEPQVHQPIAMTIDARGRLWIAEAYTYPIRAREGEGKDKIVILSDEDQNGSFETRKIFTEGLNLVSGLEVGHGGVWVGAAPYLLFIPDADGDDTPDGPPVTLLDGFGYHDTHETLNAFNWGPDGWLYGCHGVFTHSLVGAPGSPDQDRVPLNAGVWRYHPIEHRFEVFAWGSSNPWGVDFNDWGDAFITACVIPHLYHVIPGARYQRQAGQHFDPYVYDDIKTIADHLHYVGSIADHAWWGHEPIAPTDTLAAGGGHAHCGAMIYLGDNFPASYRNQIYMNNIHGNRVNCDLLEPIGTGYVGHHGRDLLIANDRWYRGINLRTGPDGTVYVIDWYDPNACHRTNPEIWDRSNGRVYNLAYGEPTRVSVNLEACSDDELAEYQLHQNDWYCRTARRILQHRAANQGVAQSALGSLHSILSGHEDTTRRLRALWTLWSCRAVSDQQLAELTTDSDPHIRRWAIRLSVDGEVVEAAVKHWAGTAASEESAPVRLAMAAAMQRLPEEMKWSVAQGLVAHAIDAEDHNQPLMLWYGIEPLVASDPARAMELVGKSQIPQVTSFILRRLASDDQLISPLIEQLGLAVEQERLDDAGRIVDAMVASFEGRAGMTMPESWVAAYDAINKLEGESPIKDQADRIAVAFGDKRIFPRLRTIVASADAADDRRGQALAILVQGQDREAVDALHQALSIEARRGEVIRALASLGDDSTAERLVEIYPTLGVEDKRDAINTLVTRPNYAAVLLTALENQTVPRSDVHAFQVRQIVGFENEELTNRLREAWGEIRNSAADRVARIEQLKALVSGPMMEQASAGRGRVVFDKTCASCHRLFDIGGDVGPDITGSNRANLDYVLENVVDPSAVMGNDYRMMLIETDDGRLISGLVKKETDSALTVRTLNDTVVVPKAEIVGQQLSDLSMMPEGLLDPLDEQAICDLIKYLGSAQQVAPKGLASPIDEATGRVPGAIEGESIEIVGKTRGSATSQNMAGFQADRWSGNDHLWWTGAGEGDLLEVALPLEADGTYSLEIVLTMARDYGVVQLELDDKPLGSPVDCFNGQAVVNTGVLRFDGLKLEAGKHKLGLRLVGSNPQAVPAFMVGLDWARWVEAPQEGASTEE